MALVLLPCDLPTWPDVQRQLNQIRNVKSSAQLVDEMYKLHSLCCISLDPDESDKSDPKLFLGLQNFLDNDLSELEKSAFFRVTLPCVVTYALHLKVYKPINGLHYSLQQQADQSELDRQFVAALVANCFFSTFPKRTTKTHPTLQDCNFANFFGHLDSSLQKRKILSFLHYFEQLEGQEPNGKIILSRQVMSKNALLSIDNWLECDKPLCPVIIRHDGKIEESEEETFKVCFSSCRIGGKVLNGGSKQEDLIFSAFPELFMMLMSTELLENNEAFTAHGLKSFITGQINHQSRDFDKDMETKQMYLSPNTHICFIDAADFSSNPSEQYQPNSILRELNKAFVGFSQQPPKTRLPPIGKSCSSTPPENQSPTNEASKSTLLSEHDGGSDHIPGYTDTSSSSHKAANNLTMDMMRSLLGQQGGLSNYLNAMLVNRKAAQTNTNVTRSSRQELDTLMAPVGCESEVCGQTEVNCAETCSKNISFSNEQSINSDKTKCDTWLGDAGNLHSSPSSSQDSNKANIIAMSVSTEIQKHKGIRDISLTREDSEDSLYRDCDESVQINSSTSCGLSLQRPLRFNTYKPTPKQSSAENISTTKVSSKPLQIPQVANVKNSDNPSRSLEGASMEASFISCRTHLSSTSSKGSSSSDGRMAEDFEQGFESCMEEEDYTDNERASKSKRDVLPSKDISDQEPFNIGQLPTQPDWCANQPHNDDEISYSTMDNGIIEHRLRNNTDDDDEDSPEPRQPGYAIRRSASTGFILDEDDDDIFVGDGLEHEREWLANFRHRSTNPSCSISRRNSSRYSFSSDFSSDLEDILEHFEEKMTEGPVRDDPTYCSRLGHGRLLKRTLSDSLTSLTRMPLGSCPRSLSLTEKMQQERIGMEYAKRKIIKEPVNTDSQLAPLIARHPGWPKATMEEESLESCTVTSAARGASMDCSNIGSCLNSPQSKTKVFQLPGQLCETDPRRSTHSEDIGHGSNDQDTTDSTSCSLTFVCQQIEQSHRIVESKNKKFSKVDVETSESPSGDLKFQNDANVDASIPILVFTRDKDNYCFETEGQNDAYLKGHDLSSSPQKSESSQMSSPDSMENFRRIMYGYQDINARLDASQTKISFNVPNNKDTVQYHILICRSISMTDAKEMEAIIKSEQIRSTRLHSLDLKAYCLQPGNQLRRSLSAKSLEELIKQENWIIKEPLKYRSSLLNNRCQKFIKGKDNSAHHLDSISGLRKWQAKINLSDIDTADKSWSNRTAPDTLNEGYDYLFEPSNRGLNANQEISDICESKSCFESNLPAKMERFWFSEDQTKSRQLDVLLEEDSNWRNCNQNKHSVVIQQSHTPSQHQMSSVSNTFTTDITSNENSKFSSLINPEIEPIVLNDVTERKMQVTEEGLRCRCQIISGDDASSSKVDVSSASSPCLHSLLSSPSNNRNILLSQNKVHQRTSDALLDLALTRDGIKPIATGNWGCGNKGGDPQLKALIQWMAASKANAPFMLYYTGGDKRIVKLNIVCRVLLDRHWSVSHVARAMLQHYAKKAQSTSENEEIDFLDCLLPKETAEL